jgi:hypothetical protein
LSCRSSSIRQKYTGNGVKATCQLKDHKQFLPVHDVEYSLAGVETAFYARQHGWSADALRDACGDALDDLRHR